MRRKLQSYACQFNNPLFFLGDSAHQSLILIRVSSHLEMPSLKRNLAQITFLLLLQLKILSSILRIRCFTVSKRFLRTVKLPF